MFGDLNCKPNPDLGPLVKPPFYGFEAHSVGVGVNSAGLRIDACARVRHVRGHPIPGLYAAGGTAAWRDIGSGYQSGIANARGMFTLSGSLMPKSAYSVLVPSGRWR